MKKVVMVTGMKVIHWLSKIFFHLPRPPDYGHCWVSNLPTAEINTKSLIWHHSLRRLTGSLVASQIYQALSSFPNFLRDTVQCKCFPLDFIPLSFISLSTALQSCDSLCYPWLSSPFSLWVFTSINLFHVTSSSWHLLLGVTRLTRYA